ncbi:MAG: hypothetical protein FWC98_00220 [Bacteroidales bacterium]|nr:hypothetical protein [Bacteroidales bacterium]
MTPEQEKQLLAAIYDRLFDAITYQPQGAKNPFTEEETFIHFSKNAAVDVKSFHNPRTPANPGGDLKTSEAFSQMVDQISPMALEWSDVNNPLSKMYINLVTGARVTTEEDPKALEIYKKAYDYLHPVVTTKNPFTNKEETFVSDSPDYVAYQNNMTTYVGAITSYRAAYNRYLDDLEDDDPNVSKKADRNWQAAEPQLANTIKGAFQNLTAGNAKYVEQALAILNTAINDGVRAAVVRAQEAIAEERQFSSSTGDGSKWLLSYPSPANWTDEKNPAFTELKISGGSTEVRSKGTEHKFSVDSSVNYGLWRVKLSAEGSFERRNSTTDTNSISIEAKIAKVSIIRPWFLESFFKLGSWSNNIAKTKGRISNGKIDSSNKDNLIPMYPVAFIVAKDIKIKADFTHKDEEHIKDAVSGKTSVGFGPFSIGGSYGYGKTQDSLKSDYQNGSITVPGMQIIAWVSRVIPFSPQEDYKPS